MKEKRLKIIIAVMSIAVIGLLVIQFYWISNLIKVEEDRFEKNVGEVLTVVVEKLEEKETLDVVEESFDSLKRKGVFFPDTSIQSTFMFDWYQEDDKKIEFEKEEKIYFHPDSNLNLEYKIVTRESDDTSYSYVDIITNKGTNKYFLSEDAEKFITNTKPYFIKKGNLVNRVVNKLVDINRYKPVEDRINKSALDSLIEEELEKSGITTQFEFVVADPKKNSITIKSDKISTVQFNNSKYKAKLFPHDLYPNPNYLVLNFPNKKTYILQSVALMLLLSILLLGIIVYVFYKTVKMLLAQKKITEVKNDLINNITHEFKTPISTIALACEALNDTDMLKSELAVKRYSGMIGEENNRLSTLVENLLNTAAIEKGEYELNYKEIIINDIISEIAESFRKNMKEKNGTIKVNGHDSNPRIFADEFHFKNILNNLFDNAIKYSGDSIEIEISTDISNKGVIIIVSDKGIGIEKKYLDKIFDTFFRIPTGNIHDVKGNGIGLSYVKKMVVAHGGSVSAKSAPKSGTEILIFFPWNYERKT